jgi:amidase
MRLKLFLCIVIIQFNCQTSNQQADTNNKEVLQVTTKGLDLANEIDVKSIQHLYASNTASVTDVTRFYLNRIEELNPSLHAVITVNPDALSIAEELDNLPIKSNLPLYGIPILLKDNIDTNDKMPCTAGSRIMANSFPAKDSPIVKQLREAGAVLLGKANLSEWANFHSLESSSGWSSLGGQTNNPYDTTRNPCGSSAGSGVAVAANLCVIAIGTETNGSIVCPSNNNGIVGIKPTVGLLSRSGIIPISFTQDTPGPMARTVRDAVIALGTMTAVDNNDNKTLQADRIALSDYTPFLKSTGLDGKRIGVWTGNTSNHPNVKALMDQAAIDCKNQGATIIELESLITREANRNSFQVLLYEFKDGLNTYLKSLGSNAPAKDLSDLIKKIKADPIEMEYHNFSLFDMANDKGLLEDEEYMKAKKLAAKLSQEQGIDSIMTEHNLDAIIAAAGGPAWKTDLVNGDNFGLSSSSPAAISAYPNICVPLGAIQGLPVGMNVFGRKWSEPILIEIAHSYEQATKHRFSPDLD